MKLIQVAVITNAAGADVATDVKAVKAETVLIVADTDELQTDDYPTLIAALPTAVEIQAEMEENGVSILDTLRDDLADGGRLDLLIDGIKAATDNLPADPADDSDLDTQLAAIAGYLDTEIAAIKAKTDDLAFTGGNVHSHVKVEDNIDFGATKKASISTAVFSYVVEGTLQLAHLLRVCLSALGGKSTGGGTISPKFRDVADGKNRISATVDGDGNRTAITLDGT